MGIPIKVQPLHSDKAIAYYCIIRSYNLAIMIFNLSKKTKLKDVNATMLPTLLNGSKTWSLLKQSRVKSTSHTDELSKILLLLSLLLFA